MPADAHHRDEVPLFDLVMGVPVATFSTLAVEPDDAHGTDDDYAEAMNAWVAAGYPCAECRTPQTLTNGPDGPGFYCPECDHRSV